MWKSGFKRSNLVAFQKKYIYVKFQLYIKAPFYCEIQIILLKLVKKSKQYFCWCWNWWKECLRVCVHWLWFLQTDILKVKVVWVTHVCEYIYAAGGKTSNKIHSSVYIETDFDINDSWPRLLKLALFLQIIIITYSVP